MSGRITIYTMFFFALISVYILANQTSYFTDVETVSAEESQGSVSDIPLPVTTARAWALFNPVTGKVVSGIHTDEVYPIASVTKLFTAYAAAESGKMDESVTITWSDLNTYGRAGKLVYGEKTTVEQLLFPLLLESSNDAGSAIERVLGDSFDTDIARVRADLGLTHTEIVDGTGLSPKNVSSPEELARFYAHIRDVHPRIIDVTRLGMYVTDETGLINNDPAHTLDSFTGGKHGFTDEAGRTFVGTFALANGSEVGVVLLGSDTLLPDIGDVLAYAEASKF